MADLEQLNELTLQRLPHGGYVVSRPWLPGRGESSFDKPLFAGDLGQCLGFIERAVTVDDRAKDPAAMNEVSLVQMTAAERAAFYENEKRKMFAEGRSF